MIQTQIYTKEKLLDFLFLFSIFMDFEDWIISLIENKNIKFLNYFNNKGKETKKRGKPKDITCFFILFFTKDYYYYTQHEKITE